MQHSIYLGHEHSMAKKLLVTSKKDPKSLMIFFKSSPFETDWIIKQVPLHAKFFHAKPFNQLIMA